MFLADAAIPSATYTRWSQFVQAYQNMLDIASVPTTDAAYQLTQPTTIGALVNSLNVAQLKMIDLMRTGFGGWMNSDGAVENLDTGAGVASAYVNANFTNPIVKNFPKPQDFRPFMSSDMVSGFDEMARTLMMPVDPLSYGIGIRAVSASLDAGTIVNGGVYFNGPSRGQFTGGAAATGFTLRLNASRECVYELSMMNSTPALQVTVAARGNAAVNLNDPNAAEFIDRVHVGFGAATSYVVVVPAAAAVSWAVRIVKEVPCESPPAWYVADPGTNIFAASADENAFLNGADVSILQIMENFPGASLAQATWISNVARLGLAKYNQAGPLAWTTVIGSFLGALRGIPNNTLTTARKMRENFAADGNLFAPYLIR
jgi:hypothetical protein